MVVDTDLFTREDLKKYHGGSKNLAYLKCMRELIRWRTRRWAEQGHRNFTLLYDKQAVRKKLSGDFREIVSYDMLNLAKGFPGCRYVHLSPVNSATLHLLQATDLLCGATWHAWEKERASDKKAAKKVGFPHISARVPLVKSSGITPSAGKAGPVTITIVPTKAGRLILARKGKLKVGVKVTFTPTGGSPNSHVIKVLLRQK
jgi:hypothetical protein